MFALTSNFSLTQLPEFVKTEILIKKLRLIGILVSLFLRVFHIIEGEIFFGGSLEMKKLLLAVFITFILGISLFGYFHITDRSLEIIDPADQTSYTEF